MHYHLYCFNNELLHRLKTIPNKKIMVKANLCKDLKQVIQSYIKLSST